jgi:hypothetical protein
MNWFEDYPTGLPGDVEIEVERLGLRVLEMLTRMRLEGLTATSISLSEYDAVHLSEYNRGLLGLATGCMKPTLWNVPITVSTTGRRGCFVVTSAAVDG